MPNPLLRLGALSLVLLTACDPDTVAGGPDASTARDAGTSSPDASVEPCVSRCPGLGATVCAGDGVRDCVDPEGDGCFDWSATVLCAGGESCSHGVCSAQCGDECAAGALGCGFTGTRACGQWDSDPCLDWSFETPCAHGERCVDGQCTTFCTDACEPGQLGCLDNGVRQCATGADGCYAWGPATPCPAGESCSNGVCRVGCAQECSAGETRCSGDAVQSCGQFDADDCLDWGPETACPACSVCSAGQCVPTCQDECPGAGQTRCDGAGVQSCGQFDADCCLEWGAAVACDDGDACTVEDTCAAGACLPGAPLVCEAGETCTAGACLCTALATDGGPKVVFDLPVSNVTLDLTYNGGAFPDYQDVSSSAVLGLQHEASSRIEWVHSFSDSTPTSQKKLRLVPGRYDVFYDLNSISFGSSAPSYGAELPRNSYLKLLSGVAVGDGTQLAVNLPVVNVTLNLTYDGGAVPDYQDVSSGASIGLRHEAAERIEWIHDFSDTDPVTEKKLRLIPGRYDVFYDQDWASTAANPPPYGPELPYNPDLRLVSGVAVGSSGPQQLTVNLPVSNVTLDLTYNGGAFPDYQGVSSGARIGLRHEDSDRIGYVHRFGDTDPVTQKKLRLVPGRYDVFYDLAWAETATGTAPSYGHELPINDEVRLMSGVAIGDGTQLAIDLPVVNVTVDLTYDGGAFPDYQDVYSSASIGMRHESSERIQWIVTISDSSPVSQKKLRLIPGRYDVFYDVGSFGSGTSPPVYGPEMPRNETLLLRSGVVIGASGPQQLAVDIPVTNVTLDLTYDGGPFLDYSGVGSGASIGLQHRDSEVIEWVHSFSDSQPAPQKKLRLIPGTYDVFYDIGSISTGTNPPAYGPELPRTGTVRLPTGFSVGNSSTQVTIDLPVSNVTLDFTYDGGAIPDYQDVTASASIGLQHENSTAIEWVHTLSDSQPSATLKRLRLLPGSYDVFYDLGSISSGSSPPVYGCELPQNGALRLGCLTVQAVPGSPNDPVPSAVLLNEVLYDPAGTDDDAFIELVGPAGTSLDGWSIAGVNGNGGGVYRTVALSGTIPGDGRYLVVHSSATDSNLLAAADLVTSCDLQNGPDSVHLLDAEGALADALAYGTFTATDVASGEGVPAAGAAANSGQSLSRSPDGNDTNDNAADWAVTPPTPGAPNP